MKHEVWPVYIAWPCILHVLFIYFLVKQINRNYSLKCAGKCQIVLCRESVNVFSPGKSATMSFDRDCCIQLYVCSEFVIAQGKIKLLQAVCVLSKRVYLCLE